MYDRLEKHIARTVQYSKVIALSSMYNTGNLELTNAESQYVEDAEIRLRNDPYASLPEIQDNIISKLYLDKITPLVIENT
jgi:hypothetical protein